MFPEDERFPGEIKVFLRMGCFLTYKGFVSTQKNIPPRTTGYSRN
jgi:hypothetical protein